MGKLSIANLKKTIYYLQRNGLRNTWNAARERLGATEDYQPVFLAKEELEGLREQAVREIGYAREKGTVAPFFSILVPAYRTAPQFLRELTESLSAQVYPLWELILLDASEDTSVHDALEEICNSLGLLLTQSREGESVPEQTGEAVVRYVALGSNEGISGNTNAGIAYARGNYIGLLDHDDVLTPDALYEMAKKIMESRPLMLYSDEDKWDGEGRYYEPNRKEDFNLDLLLSNNYICHFLVMDAALFGKLKLRREFDGAQDYDLVLRAAGTILAAKGKDAESEICHIPKVLYHWRCHSASTAENPHSKMYAYEAGRRALQDFANGQEWKAKSENLKHVGFYRLAYGTSGEDGPGEILAQRKDIGAIGGKLLGKAGQGHERVSGRASWGKEAEADAGVIAGGRMAKDGEVYYAGLRAQYSGYLHRAVLTQDAEAVDLRCIIVAQPFRSLFEETVGVPYRETDVENADGKVCGKIFDAGTLPENADIRALSLAFCESLRREGMRILWDPQLIMKL